MGKLERRLDDSAIARVRAGIKPVKNKKEKLEHNPRAASTYRGARRNECLRTEPKSVWGPDWYYQSP
jgi:hypothetical protein